MRLWATPVSRSRKMGGALYMATGQVGRAIYIYIYMHMYVCMYVCVYVCMYD